MLVKQGHKVFFLTTCERGFLHDYVENIGVKADAINLDPSAGKLQFYSANIRKLFSFVRANNIDVVIAHQQIPALIAGIVRKLMKFTLIFVRHNSDEDYHLSYAKAKWLNRFTNWLTPIKVAPSSVVQKHWEQKERVPQKQIRRINYGYNFQQYEKPVTTQVESIKAQYPTSFRVLSIARLSAAKRHNLAFEVIEKLVKQGIDCKLLCLGNGPLRKELEVLINEKGLQQHIFLLGRKENIFDYISAADAFLHLSMSEASNSAVKEVGLCRKPVIVCKQVGDFEDYIVNKENGFLIDKNNPIEEAVEILKNLAQHKISKEEIGAKLYETIMEQFEINRISDAYKNMLLQVG